MATLCQHLDNVVERRCHVGNRRRHNFHFRPCPNVVTTSIKSRWVLRLFLVAQKPFSLFSNPVALNNFPSKKIPNPSCLVKDYAKAHYPRSFLHLPRFCPLIHYKESSADYNVNKYYDYTMKKKLNKVTEQMLLLW